VGFFNDGRSFRSRLGNVYVRTTKASKGKSSQHPYPGLFFYGWLLFNSDFAKYISILVLIAYNIIERDLLCTLIPQLIFPNHQINGLLIPMLVFLTPILKMEVSAVITINHPIYQNDNY